MAADREDGFEDGGCIAFPVCFFPESFASSAAGIANGFRPTAFNVCFSHIFSVFASATEMSEAGCFPVSGNKIPEAPFFADVSGVLFCDLAVAVSGRFLLPTSAFFTVAGAAGITSLPV
ncbi:MAG: hypothetical protein IJV46_07825 [Acidaminococcaceae bacterium]|nr:hypothetical protein [Acidaminococcaceae bacterium]